MMMEAATAGEAWRVVGIMGAAMVVAVRLAVATLWWGGAMVGGATVAAVQVEGVWEAR